MELASSQQPIMKLSLLLNLLVMIWRWLSSRLQQRHLATDRFGFCMFTFAVSFYHAAAMQPWYCDEQAILLSVHLSVYPSLKRVNSHVWSPCYTRAISEHFRHKELIYKVLYKFSCLLYLLLKQNKLLPTFFYDMKDQCISFSDRKKGWWGTSHSAWSCGPKWPTNAFINNNFQSIFARNASATLPSWKSLIITNRTSSVCFPMSLRWMGYDAPKPSAPFYQIYWRILGS